MFSFSQIDPFTILLALGPIVAYLAIFSWIRLSGRVLVTTGGRDTAALAIAIAGLLAVGPAQLFFPSTAATLFGPLVWVALAMFYFLCVALWVLTSHPRLVVYGRTAEQTFPALVRAAQQIDSSTIADESTFQVHLPSVGVHLRVDGQSGMDFARVVSFENAHSLKFWNLLLGHLRGQMATTAQAPLRHGFGMLAAAVVLGLIVAWQGFGNQALVVEGFRDWLWR